MPVARAPWSSATLESSSRPARRTRSRMRLVAFSTMTRSVPAYAPARDRARASSRGIARPPKRSPCTAMSRDNSRTIWVSTYGPPDPTSASHSQAAQRALAAGTPPAGGHRDRLLGGALLRPGSGELGRELEVLHGQSQVRDDFRRPRGGDARLDQGEGVRAFPFLRRVRCARGLRERPADRRAEGIVRPGRAQYARGVPRPRQAGEGRGNDGDAGAGRRALPGGLQPVP